MGQAEVCKSGTQDARGLTVRLSLSYVPRDCASHDLCHQPGPGPILGDIPMGGCRNHGECATHLAVLQLVPTFHMATPNPTLLEEGGVEENGRSALTPIFSPPQPRRPTPWPDSST